MNFRLRRKVEREEWVRRQQSAGPSSLVSPCEAHPQWQVNVADGRLAPSAAECPVCKTEAMRNRSTERDERIVSNPSEITRATSGQLERAALFFEQHPSTEIKPGSRAEADALARIDELREIERERDDRRSKHAGILISQRIEGGRLVQYLARRGGIMKVTV